MAPLVPPLATPVCMGGGVPLPRVGIFFEISCIKMALFFLHIKMASFGVGYVKLHIPIPYFALLNFFYSNQGGRHGPLCPLAMPV